MNRIESFAHETFAADAAPQPLEVAASQAPVLGTPGLALSYGALTFAAYMAGNVVTDFAGGESPTDGVDELQGRSGAELLELRSQRIADAG